MLVQPRGQDPILDDLLEAFAERLESGTTAEMEAFIAEHPERAEVLRRLLPVIQALASLERSGASMAPAGSDPQVLGELGDFLVMREIGRGGMGVVYEAEQISLGRRVALKVLPFAAALDSKQLQRFKNEAQAAAHLHHTNIVPVFGVGTERGVHYYAMQYIEGHTLASAIAELRQRPKSEPAAPAKVKQPEPDATGPYSGAQLVAPAKSGRAEAATPTVPVAATGLSTEHSSHSPAFFRTAANLGIQAAEALEHAHQVGIIHRDIKPANLLIDTRGKLWITDFGLAHCQSQAELTVTGDLVGTLRYMSPEQVLAKRVPIDHRTDIYSLGATLYELLTLEPVFGAADRQELLRSIAFEDPRPPRRRNPAIPNELETIVLKALDKNPGERYGTAQELADDLRRFLEDRPIRARRPSVVSRVRKWARRHRSVVTATIVSTILALAVGFALMAWQWRVAEHRRKQAELAEVAARKSAAQREIINQFLIDDLLGQATPTTNAVGDKITVRDLLDKAAGRIENNDAVAAEPEVEATIRHAIGAAYTNLGQFDRAEPHLRRAVEIRRHVLGEMHPETLSARNTLGFLLFLEGKFADAERVCRESVLDSRASLGGEDKETLRALRHLGLVLSTQGKRKEAEIHVRQRYEIIRRLEGPDHPSTLDARSDLLYVVWQCGRLDESEALLHENLEAHRRAGHPEKHPLVVSNAAWQPMLLVALGNWDKAEAEFRNSDDSCRHVFGPEHYETISNLANWAALLHARHKDAQAGPLLRECVRLYRKVQPDHPLLALSLYEWGTFLLERDDKKEAESVLREALTLQRKLLVQDHYWTGQTLVALGWTLTISGRPTDGEPLLREALDICRRTLPRGDWFTADSESLLGGCLSAQGKHEEAEPLVLSGYKGLLAAAGTPPVTDSWTVRFLGSLYTASGAPPEHMRQALNRIIELYEAWGKTQQAGWWRAIRSPSEQR
jgi:serine/threonine protein kinase